jgi:hypothetical protein
MCDTADLLDLVVAELTRRSGQLRQVARDSGLPYDTVLRIKNRENEPGYFKVKKLGDFLGVSKSPPRSNGKTKG